MISKYDESARKLAQQKKERKRVIRRRKMVRGAATGILVIALGVGMAYGFVKGLDKEWAYQDQQMASYRAEMAMNQEPFISDEERKQAEKEYVEDHYSAETIGDLKVSVITEYGVLIDAIVDNESMKSNTNVKPLDSNRLDKTIAAYGTFKSDCSKDSTNYAAASEEDRIDKATSLYHQKQQVLEAELVEANQKAKYLTSGTEEYNKNQENIEDINRKLNSIKSALEVVGDRSLTIYYEQQQSEEGKQR